ncbi:MAG: hypothetical protein A2428_07305 [Bdellovibrionales bacterium RIFOXYC1_FULL_54_43]|nr:MAG: hypothetical protein A2428_07305 [Bdellovibrionales bacterium RIFOXYC1_FULL_54_43]OFZ85841.1 MAG: hypothetical protein A2603_13675 [Bdellovibrionales bacterium RIFOXYD1_FULL_55_31]
MKISILFLVWVLSASASAFAAPRVSVLRFNQEVDHVLENCRGWIFSNQNQLHTVLESELTKRGLKVLERRGIRQVYSDEFMMENLSQASRPQKHKFLSAQYVVTGGITELGICVEGSDTGVQLGGLVGLLGGPAVDLEIGKKKAVSTVKLVANLVSTETGEVIRTFSAQANVIESEASVSAGVEGIEARHATQSIPPIEQAANKAIVEIASQIAKYLG